MPYARHATRRYLPNPANEDWSFLLQRYLFGTDVHMGPRARVFVELQSAVINGRLGGPRPRDQDLLDLHQGLAKCTP